ncbi:condensation domain-containing protein, partial [Gordonia paraffinivorans]
DIAIGTPVAGRGEQVLDDLVGMFVNTLVLRAEVDADVTFGELLNQVRRRDLAAFEHTDVPFERLVEVLDPVRSTAHHPLFQVSLALQNQERTEFELPGLAVSGFDPGVEVTQFDLALTLGDAITPDGSPDGMYAYFTYATDLFDSSTVAGFAEMFTRVLS